MSYKTVHYCAVFAKPLREFFALFLCVALCALSVDGARRRRYTALGEDGGSASGAAQYDDALLATFGKKLYESKLRLAQKKDQKKHDC